MKKRPDDKPPAAPKKASATKRAAKPKAPKPPPSKPVKAAPPPQKAEKRAKPRAPEKAPRTDHDAAHADPAVVAQIRELEAQLDRLIDEASRRDLSALAGDDDEDDHEDDAPFDAEATVVNPASAPASPPRMPFARPSGPLPHAVAPSESTRSVDVPHAPASGTVFDTARELLGADFYLRKWGRMAMRGRSEEVDDFGFDPIYDAKFRRLLDFLYTTYFRVETHDIERVPSRGRCLLVANHSGTVPLDGVMIKTAVKREHPDPRHVRWLTEDFIYHFPFLGSVMNRLGAVRACQENAERLLASEELVAVFPEGVKGIGKLFSERYRLQRFGRGGFIKLCLRTGTPIVPVAVVGAEETNPMLFKLEYMSKAIGVPYVPVTPTFPLLGPFGLLPAPTKWQIFFGEPLDLSGHGPDAADDEILVGKLAERVRASIQGMLDRAVGARKSVFFAG